MKFVIKHEMKGRIRLHMAQRQMSIRQADILQYYLTTLPQVKAAKVYERTCDAVVRYEGDRKSLLEGIQKFSYADEKLAQLVPKHTGRALNREYKEKLIRKVLVKALTKTFFPSPLNALYTAVQAVPYLWKGIRCLANGRLEVEVLDATAITVSMARSDVNTAGSIMFLLGIGGLLEEWTRKKSVNDLARSMSLNIGKVWQKVDGARGIGSPVPDLGRGFGDRPCGKHGSLRRHCGGRRSHD